MSKTLSNHSVSSADRPSNCGSTSGCTHGKDGPLRRVEALVGPRLRLGYPPGICELRRQRRGVHRPTARPFQSQDGLFPIRESHPRPVHFIESLVFLDGLCSRISSTNQPETALQPPVAHEFPRHVRGLSHVRTTRHEFPKGSSRNVRRNRGSRALRGPWGYRSGRTNRLAGSAADAIMNTGSRPSPPSDFGRRCFGKVSAASSATDIPWSLETRFRPAQQEYRDSEDQFALLMCGSKRPWRGGSRPCLPSWREKWTARQHPPSEPTILAVLAHQNIIRIRESGSFTSSGRGSTSYGGRPIAEHSPQRKKRSIRISWENLRFAPSGRYLWAS